MNVVAVIQARMGSTRLPGKVLMPLAGRPAIEHVVQRVRMIAGISRVVVATTSGANDDRLANFCESVAIDFFRGDEEDVLDRYYRTAIFYEADVVIRITADCPLLDPVESGRVLERYRMSGADYVCNVMPPTLPDGLDTEVMRLQALEMAWHDACKKSEREHVTLYIRNNPNKFQIENVESEIGNLNQHRWTLDEVQDYQMLAAVFVELKKRGQFGSVREVLSILEDNPQIQMINKGIDRNEGLQKSLLEEAGKA